MQDFPTILALSCRFPDAATPDELIENVIAGRRSFRPIPRERLDITRYAADIVGTADSITPIRAGLLTNWNFDRSRFMISRATAENTDLAHWLALELAAEAIETIGGVETLDRSRTAVVVANTLTGEFSRAALLRLRLPFLDQVLAQVATREGLTQEVRERLRSGFDAELRQRFPEPNEDSLAGALANTIAGRIANYFDFRGGAYSLDGACASSLVALADAANLIAREQVDAVIVAAVDLSLDPFELVGFSRNGALAGEAMRVFDARAAGFWPGEGGACAVLMREQTAMRRGLAPLARLRGWGISSDGAGGLTRPSLEGQLAAAQRACDMAGIDPADIAYVEAHGTGTAVGDPIEVRALSALRAGARAPLPIGSIKANIGHTKAAAGFAGLIKSVEALRRGLVPPHVSCETPHPVFAEVDHRIRPSLTCDEMGETAIAGISSFGFGGINSHIVIERMGGARRTAAPAPRPLCQDAELFVFSAAASHDLVASMSDLQRRTSSLSMAELIDAAARASEVAEQASIRVAVIASDGLALADGLARAIAAVENGEPLSDVDGDVFVGRPLQAPRVGFLFPGQGAPCRPNGGIWRHRFDEISEMTDRLPFPDGRRAFDTDIAQPAIVGASLAALRILQRLGVAATAAAGHSLGEITALAWADALDIDAAQELASRRGAIMARTGAAGGAMLRVVLPWREALHLAEQTGTSVACRNGRAETVLSGHAAAIDAAASRCTSLGIEASRLVVSHAFHSPAMAPAAKELEAALQTLEFRRCAVGQVISTVTGAPLTQSSNLRHLLVDQLVQPVLFDAALDALASRSDYLVEVGPGEGLTRLARNNGLSAMSVDACGPSLVPLLRVVGGLFAAGAKLRPQLLFEDRTVRPFEVAQAPSFLQNPCGSHEVASVPQPLVAAPSIDPRSDIPDEAPATALAAVLSAIARETGLDPARVGRDDRLLDKLHLNSLAVTRIVIAASRLMQVRAPAAPTEFTNATPRILADALAELQTMARAGPAPKQRIAGVRPWTRCYAMAWQRGDSKPGRSAAPRWLATHLGRKPAAMRSREEDGLLIWIDEPMTPAEAAILVAQVSEAAKAGFKHLALCHGSAPISAFGRSVESEGYFRSVRVIDRADASRDDPRLAELLSCDFEGYDEVRIAAGDGIEHPVFLPFDPPRAASGPLTAKDVVVAIGGGKGITAECALALAGRGAAVILVGRSQPDDPAVATTLATARARALRCSYVVADVLEGNGLTRALAGAIAEHGQPTALLYAPAVNQPARLVDLDAETVQRTIALKTIGLKNALNALDGGLRRLITFGSIIGRIGLAGETHYALANALQSAATLAWAEGAPSRTALAIEWTVWGGIGMGERLGTIERLGALGVDAIAVDAALETFGDLIDRGSSGIIAVTSRFGAPPHLSLGSQPLPMLRFVDEPKIYFPGVELVIETRLDHGRDLYLADHIVGGAAVLPAVLGLEAMAQVAAALTPAHPHGSIRNVSFERAVTVDEKCATRLRLAALQTAPGTTEVKLFACERDADVLCMQATFAPDANGLDRLSTSTPSHGGLDAKPLYGPLFFNGSRFRRLDSIETATSRQLGARLSVASATRWFSSYEPDRLLLWDPGATDAILHALQATIPHRRVIPVSVGRIDIDRSAGQPHTVSAVERWSSGRLYVFDLVVRDAEARPVQRWSEATFRAVDTTPIAEILAASPALAAPYLERLARETLGEFGIRVAVVLDPHASREARRLVAMRQLALAGRITRRTDGKPIVADGKGFVSFAHRDGVTLAVAADAPVGCDIELSGGAVDSQQLRSHVMLETCRKLGRRPPVAAFAPAALGTAHRIEDTLIVVAELPLPGGAGVAAIGRYADTAPAVRFLAPLAASEAAP
ncbi:SDR family NAD(P)-dependent oxidoreductase [Bradyrhizobium sp. SZCCHNRI1029]|uniref:SDR family NAD(P)-dependent oxidoreductase n=1 Tax=Bradyrhizobium sp. SZCCHNRI1029 TaxID=3057278 RepID=UPI0029166202|nr:SDR family NAD(P)-dependent oxidoreductase [Bradyrhizobium sp. SZCCHNRI1029]